MELVSFDERKRLVRAGPRGETQLIVSPIPSGHSLGGVAWRLEFHKAQIIYAVDLHSESQQISLPMQIDRFSTQAPNVLITNGFLNFNAEGRNH